MRSRLGGHAPASTLLASGLGIDFTTGLATSQLASVSTCDNLQQRSLWRFSASSCPSQRPRTSLFLIPTVPQGIFYMARKFYCLFQQHSSPHRIQEQNLVRRGSHHRLPPVTQQTA